MVQTVHEHRLARDEIDRLDDLCERIEEGADLRGYVIRGLRLAGIDDAFWEDTDLREAIFLGCTFRDRDQEHRVERLGAYVFPRFRDIPYDPWRATLYTVDELMEGYEDGGYTATRDFEIFTHFDRFRRDRHGVPITEALAQRIHDHAVDEALEELLEIKEQGAGVVGIMGGHGTPRTDPYYAKVARASWDLTRAGYFVASGGGPGIMEAANLGAWLANYAEPSVLDRAIEMMSEAPTFAGDAPEGTPAYLEGIRTYLRLARRVTETFAGDAVDPEIAERYGRERPEPGESLAVPTWFYGHEPSNLFSTHIAKYFANSIRESGLLAISHAGVIYAPGSAGTMQEVFMDLAQNHYATFSFRSPMVFLGRERYEEVGELLRAFVADRGQQEVYGDLITVVEEAREVVGFIQDNPPRPALEHTPLYEMIDERDDVEQ